MGRLERLRGTVCERSCAAKAPAALASGGGGTVESEGCGEAMTDSDAGGRQPDRSAWPPCELMLT
jgi:hypothetical protein